MRASAFLIVIALAGCATAPPPPPPVPPGWDGHVRLVLRAAAAAAMAGHDPAESYRSGMIMACALRERIAISAEELARANLECERVAQMPAPPKPVSTDCGPNYDGGMTCVTH